MRFISFAILAGIVAGGCSGGGAEDPRARDEGTKDEGTRDEEPRDSGGALDAFDLSDLSDPSDSSDQSDASDAGPPPDAGALDASDPTDASDAGASPDGGGLDASDLSDLSDPSDAGPEDAGAPDAGFTCNEEHADWTVGLKLCRPGAFEGYTLFAPLRGKVTYLIDILGRVVHSWQSDYKPGNSVYLLPDGRLLHTAAVEQSAHPTFLGAGVNGGRVQIFEWDGAPAWDFLYSSDRVLQHHDAKMLPSGNVIMIAFEAKTRAEAVEAGRKPSLVGTYGLWPDHLIEVRPDGPTTGTIVWEWHLWDHLIQDADPTKADYGDVAAHPELVDINFSTNNKADWNHTNSVAYNEAFDQLVVSVHQFSEIWVVDHSTTTAEAAGHSGGRYGRGGDLLYRWGNPQAYRAGGQADQMLFAQHDAHWIAPGLPGADNILIFNNGVRRGYSTVDEISPPVDGTGRYRLTPGGAYDPDALAWTYLAPNPPDFFSNAISGSQRQPSGTTLICEGQSGNLFEVTPAGEIVWQYINPVVDTGPLHQGDEVPAARQGGPLKNNVFSARRYAPDYPALSGRDLSPKGYVELPPR